MEFKYALVCIEGCPHLDKSCAAGVTAVRFLPRVDAGVSLQVGRAVELGAAHVAAVRFVTCRRERSPLDIGFISFVEKAKIENVILFIF